MAPFFQIRNEAIAAAFKQDCDVLLNDFASFHTTSFEKFSEIWRDMRFTSVFMFDTKKRSPEFVRLALLIAKQYLFHEDSYTQVGALYLLYGLYFKQPKQYVTFCSIYHFYIFYDYYIIYYYLY